jgi:RimJ/RimL family protein N-acetyltransferase
MKHETPPALLDGVTLPERIDTEELLIRHWTPDDLQQRYDAILVSYEHLRPWFQWLLERPSLDEQREWGKRQEAERRPGGQFSYGIFRQADGTLMGVIGVHDRVGPGALEIGYWCHVDQVGKGVITTAAREITRVVLALQGIERAEIHCDPENLRSAAVARRLGYRLDRIEPRTAVAPAESGSNMVWIKRRDQV